MRKTAVVFSPKYYEHNPGKNHPESPKRLQAIINELENGELARSQKWQFIPPTKANVEDVELVHSTEYIKLIEAVCKAGGGFLDLEDTAVSPQSYEVALYAVGGTIKAVDSVMNGTFRNAFALIRPPGHHASKFRACGFCLFNNVSIAAEYLQKKYRLQRILILDIDAHHGNGTQETFYETDNILYISLHEDPSSFPGTGFADEIGEGKGLGYTVNIPLPFGTSDQTYLKAMKEIAVPIIRQYKPQFMLVSSGFDAYHTDPVGNLSLSASCYKETYRIIIDLASKTCRNRVVAVLEGGYRVKWIGKLAASALAQMCGTSFSTRDRVPRIEKRTSVLGEKVIKDVKKAQKSYWNLD
jgi:acetoin utilization deacetylase AcuC-like enzyme